MRRARIIRRLSPVSATHANGVAWRTSYAARVRTPLAILLTLGACTDHGAARLTKIKDQVCACTTASCAEQAMAQVTQEKIDANHRTQAIARGMLDCLAKLQAAERPVTDPDAEDKAGSDEPAPAATAPAAGKPAAANPTTARPAPAAPAARPAATSPAAPRPAAAAPGAPPTLAPPKR
jgi:hypothetical protein